ncbi:DUF481 domain-containing protein [Thalassotalea agarivorans]|uniref:Putative salt-induced outer membrane protein YdiY n=1 Tax=Thalassotalea agarivorans TaxID=349064 RepID=A0A1I0H4F9_THASX|nr:DUF481 domain-containing protein [Thalassotalea agarivorans]SET77593.1 Putative salt-induced outer membrane protein YdiY [Thalassotalea agarivorans]
MAISWRRANKDSNILMAFRVLFIAFLSISYSVAVAQEQQWQTPAPVIQQNFDWLKTSSGEWLKGDIVAMYDEELEFDSDEFGLVTVDWEDVAELYSKEEQSIRLSRGRIVVGRLTYKAGNISISTASGVKQYSNRELVSVASSKSNRWDLWDGKISLGADLKKGNSIQSDLTIDIEFKRRTSSSRFETTYVSSYSETEDAKTGNTFVTTENIRLNSFIDLFVSQKLFLRIAEFEYFRDEFQNIDYRITGGVAVGYQVVDTSKVDLEFTAGPSYQETKYIEVDSGEEIEDSGVMTLGSNFDWEITSNIDYFFDYQLQLVSEQAGNQLHHIETGFEFEVVNDFDINFTFYMDRTDKPRTDSDGFTPEKDDFRYVVSIGYEF